MRRRIALLSAALVPVLAALFIVRRSNVPKPIEKVPVEPMDDQVTHPPSPSPTPTPTPREPGE